MAETRKINDMDAGDFFKGDGVSWKPMLEVVPVQNSLARVKRSSTGSLSVAVKTLSPAWYRIPPLSWVVRPPKQKTAVLDQLGGQIWDLCDGNRSVEGIIDAFAQRHKLTFHEARVSVTGYIKMLVQRGALAIVT